MESSCLEYHSFKICQAWKWITTINHEGKSGSFELRSGAAATEPTTNRMEKE
jgi:hypothetical protein